MSDGFDVDTEVLRAHAARVGQVAGQVAAARAAAGSTALHGGVFGVLCAFLPAVVAGVDGAAREALSAVAAASDRAVTELGSMAREFDAVDERVGTVLRNLARDVGR